MTLTTLYIILALFRRIAWSNDKMFSLDLALSKSVYSASSITLQARLWSLVISDTLQLEEFPQMIL